VDYATLIADKATAGSIRSWVNHNLLDVAQIVEEAEALIAQTLRVREMRVSATLALAAGESAKALPAGFLDPIALTDTTNALTLSLRGEADLERLRRYEAGVLAAGVATSYAIFDEALQFETQYDGAATLRLLYFARWTPLATSGTNFLTARYPHLLRTACLAGAHAFRNNDTRQQLELQKLATLIQKTNAESDLSYRGLAIENHVG
jgi:hypothetical protein